MAAESADPNDDLATAVLAADRTAIGRAITLVESSRREDRLRASALLEELLPHAGKAQRVGITGVPGVGKSTFIDTLGTLLTGRGLRVAVLTVDPSSARTGGSILGDKTRMTALAGDDNAFIRPSPSAGAFGGVTASTREAILVLEAAGHDVIIVETVGVGQSETIVHSMVDVFVVLMLAGAGDELQGIKRGVLEFADVLAVNKADGANIDQANLAAGTYRQALHLLAPASLTWSPPVLTCSALTGDGVDQVWEHIEAHRASLEASGERAARRQEQLIEWMGALLRDRLLERFDFDTEVADRRARMEEAVLAGTISVRAAVDRVLDGD